MARAISVLGICVCLSLPTFVLAIETTFTPLGFLPGYEYSNYPTSMADDGSTVVGWSVNLDSVQVPYVWRRSSGIQPLDSLIPGSFESVVISGDGHSIFVANQDHAARWTEASGLVQLFAAPAGTVSITYVGSSTDGAALTGIIQQQDTPETPSRYSTFVWQENDGFSLIEDGFQVRGISPDGDYLVGNRRVDPETGASEAVRRSIDGTERVVQDGLTVAQATTISQGGNVVAGLSGSDGFRWTDHNDQSMSVGRLLGQNDTTSVLDMSFDGSILVGYAESAPQGAFIWDVTHGMRSIHALLVEQGLEEVSERSFYAARFVSADGRTILGSERINGEGAWVATLVPEPSTCLVTILGFACAVVRRRTRSGSCE